MAKELREQYEQMQRELILEIKDDQYLTADIVLTKILRLHQILSGAYLKNINNNMKLTRTLEIILDNPEEKVVVWFKYRESLALVKHYLSKLNNLIPLCRKFKR